MTTTDESPETTIEEPPATGEASVPAEPPSDPTTGRTGMRKVFAGAGERVGRPLVAGLLAATLTGLVVLLATELRGDEYEARIGLLATPSVARDGQATAQYGEVVSLTLPALVEVARSPSVLREAAAAVDTAPDELAEHVAVELVPASGLARLSVRAPSAAQADTAATAIARSMVDAQLLAPVGTLRVLDERPDVAQVAPDRRLGIGLALAAAVVAGVTVAALRHLRPRGDTAVRAALTAAGVHHPVTTAQADEPDLPERLAALCTAADLAPRVVAVTPSLSAKATALARLIPETHCGPGTAVIAVTPNTRRQNELGAVAAALPADCMLLAVVLA